MKFLRESIDKEIQFAKSQSKNNSTRKTIGCLAETIGCLYKFTNIKSKFKELRDRENAHRCLYWFTLNPELHPVFSETNEEQH